MLRTLVIMIASVVFVSTAMAQQSVDAETIRLLRDKVQSLRAAIDDSNELLELNRSRINDTEEMISNAEPFVNQTIERLQTLVDEFKSGSAVEQGIQEAIRDISKNYDRFREGSDIQKRAAASLEASRERFEDINDSRDALVGRALAEIRNLKARRDDIVAVQIAGAYDELSGIYETIVTGFGTTVKSAEDVTRALDDVTQSRTPSE